ncbi:MAG TPA: hypothetical protein PKU71_11555 [bacterium]|nr:hypothetical protein [bacterium]HNH30050.1 hypothetical protein [bacterium]HNH33942.1 hypothetical protein [bacterium]
MIDEIYNKQEQYFREHLNNEDRRGARSFGFSRMADDKASDGEPVFIVNTPSVDGHRSVISPRGLDFSNKYYKNNPIWVFDHDNRLVVGQADGSGWIKYSKADKSEIKSKIRYASTDFPQEVRTLVVENILRMASIWFDPIVQFFDQAARSEYEKDYADLGLKAPDYMNWYIKESGLLHNSIVAIGSNLDAYAQARGSYSPEMQRAIEFAIMQEVIPSLRADIAALRAELVTLRDNGAKNLTESIKEKEQAIADKVADMETERKAGDGESPLCQSDKAVSIPDPQKVIEATIARDVNDARKLSVDENTMKEFNAWKRKRAELDSLRTSIDKTFKTIKYYQGQVE